MKKLFWVLVLIAMLGSIFISSGFTQVAVTNTTCPVMPGERVKQKFYVDYQGTRVYLCCRNCVIKFKREPEKYMKVLGRS